MNSDERIALIAERARDADTERVHGGDGVEAVERYTDAAWLDCMADLILPTDDNAASELRYQISKALYWLEPTRVLDRMDCSVYAVEHISKIGQIIVSTAIKNGLKLEEL